MNDGFDFKAIDAQLETELHEVAIATRVASYLAEGDTAITRALMSNYLKWKGVQGNESTLAVVSNEIGVTGMVWVQAVADGVQELLDAEKNQAAPDPLTTEGAMEIASAATQELLTHDAFEEKYDVYGKAKELYPKDQGAVLDLMDIVYAMLAQSKDPTEEMVENFEHYLAGFEFNRPGILKHAYAIVAKIRAEEK